MMSAEDLQTKPLSMARPTEADLHKTFELQKVLVNAGVYESKEEAAKREEVLDRIGERELNKAQWSTLFEPYLFFESYRNYLQIDIVAVGADDLRAWKGWVEARLRQLTLMFIKSFIGFWDVSA